MYRGHNDSISSTTSKTFKIDRLVLKIMSPHLEKGHFINMDNYYNSVTLSNILLQKKDPRNRYIEK